ncbi:hypothetical protein [Paremcibacter congregatus]|uniref:hypothetical protein n=1 Tax=Paremcibacter congregatus TaxID=2043170 RepID=UPI003A92E771
MSKNPTFRAVLEATVRESANDNLDPLETAERVVTDLYLGGFSIRRTFDPVDYALPIKVLHTPQKGTAGSYDAMAQLLAPSVGDLGGDAGWLVIWTENGMVRSAWFDHEGVSRYRPDYRVINPKSPVPAAICAGARAAQSLTPTQKVA